MEYTVLSEIDHIIKRPEVVIGSIDPITCYEYISNHDLSIISYSQVNVSEALIRIFVEVLANAVDNSIRSNGTCSYIKITVDENGKITIKNNGNVISIAKHKNGMFNHELVFGHLRSSSNYNDNVKRETSGKNGLGVKCTNILSSEFKITGTDNGKKLIQIWNNNMKNTKGPKITTVTVKDDYTEISFIPDKKLFNIEKYSQDILGIFRKNAIDAALNCIPYKTNVFYNGKKICIKKFSDYMNLYIDTQSVPPNLLFQDNKSECIVALNNGNAISFVNGLFTKDGGKHVDGWKTTIISQCSTILSTKKEFREIPKATISKALGNNLQFFVKSIVDKPQFDNQNKHKLILPSLTYNADNNTILKLLKWKGIYDILREKQENRENSQITKALKSKKHVCIKDYDPANLVGKSNKCTLILCEGLSAKTYAVAGLSTGLSLKWKDDELSISGRDWFGIMPLRGKFLNVRNVNKSKMTSNVVIMNLIQALGLVFGKDYGTEQARKTLNYGRCMIIPDPDEDGIHIEGLILNFFHYHFPGLLKDIGTFPFLFSMKIPIIEVGNQVFYTLDTFHNANIKSDKIKYFKGLGTVSNSKVGQRFGKKILVFSQDSCADSSMDKAFKLDQADDRKLWIQNYSPTKKSSMLLDNPQSIIGITISDFINHHLIKFSIEHCNRSLPKLMDGLKDAQRKVLYGLLLSKESIKVAQLGALVAQKTDYKHGEQNLFETIIKMAQSFVGSNNIPLLDQDGQFGTRLSGGKDAASPRYIFTKQSLILRSIIKEEDDPILPKSDGQEPLYYLPIIPMLVINGCVGVGTGFSCNIPCYNPKDIITNIKKWLCNTSKKHIFNIHPWYRSFTGNIVCEPKRYVTWGVISELSNICSKHKKCSCYMPKLFNVTELPIGMWSDTFKEMCQDLLQKNLISSWKFGNSETDKVSFIIEADSDITIEKLKLRTFLTVNNMTIIDDLRIKTFPNINSLLQKWCKDRLEFYKLRKDYWIQKYKMELKFLKNKKKFISQVMEKKISVFLIQEKQIILQLEQQKYDKYENGYDYLLNLNIKSFTKEKITLLDRSICDIEEKFNFYFNVSIEDLWTRDLEKLESILDDL